MKRKSAPRSAAFKAQIHAGSAIARRLPQRMTQTECARRLGCSQEAIRRTEALALYKVQQRLRALFRTEIV